MEYKLERERLVKVVALTQEIIQKHKEIAETTYSVGKLNYSSGIASTARAVELALDDGNFSQLHKINQ